MVVAAPLARSARAGYLPGVHGLYGIIDSSASPGLTHAALADAFLGAGVRIVQLRMKGAPTEQVAAAIDAILPRVRAAGATLVLNDHVTLAARYEGVGAHVGQGDLDAAEARALLGPDRLLGLSTHCLADLHRAAALPIDYVGFGPVFTAAGKHRQAGDRRPVMEPRGIAGLKAALDVATVPLVAIGGIDMDNLADVLGAGARCVAVISAVTAAPDPRTAACALQRALDR